MFDDCMVVIFIQIKLRLIYRSFNMIEVKKVKPFNRFCNWIDLPSCLYIVGAVVWSSLIALYRVLFVRAQNLAIFDSKNTTERMCFHYSIDDVNIIMDYNVSIL
jgi:uncharacterized integral membrane protein